jgi:hypothetical protein
MRYWLRTHLTYANVMVTILAFIVLTGGTAVALNGTDTVQSDDLGPGAQVKAPDVADNAVNSADVAADSLNGADILESSLTGDMRKLSYSVGASSANPPPKTTLPTAGPYTIKAQCYIDFSADVHVRLYANGPAGTQNSLWSQTANNNTDHGNFSGGTAIAANTDAFILDITGGAGSFERGGGTTMLRTNTGVLVQVDFHAVADARFGQQSCFIYGTATRAT